MRPSQATFIGIGGQKCATTWLYSVLQQCPDIRVSDEKEVDFFSYYYDRGYEWYERALASDPVRRHRGEISPSYLVHPDAPRRAAAYNPRLQILVTLRDPVRRAFSNHLHEVKKGHVTGDNLVFETALEQNPFYREQGLYARHLARWFDHFPQEQIHVFFQEDIALDRAAMADRVTDALSVPRLTDFLDLRANESVRYRNPRVGETLWTIGSYARRNGLGRVVETVKSAPGVRQLRAANREAMTEVVEGMRPDTEAALTAYYAEDVAALERLLGQPAPWARFAKAA